MARKQAESRGGRIRRVASKIAQVFHRKHDEESEAPAAQEMRSHKQPQQSSAAKRVTRPSDIGVDVLSRTYTPPATNTKASFRSDGSDRQSDQELVNQTVVDERWNDEDRFTNKSGDPRIGTHGRTYEPGEMNDQQGRG